MLIGTWQDSKETNRWVRFTPDGKVISQDAQKSMFLGGYTVTGPSNSVVVLVDNTTTNTSTVPFYFLSPNEVIMQFPDETILFNREKSN